LPTVNELAAQELAKRYSLANRTRVAPRVQTMRAAEPSIRSSLSEFMRDVVDATGLSGGYRQGLLNAAGGLETSADFAPYLGGSLAMEDAARSYRQGDLLGTGINLLGVIPGVGKVASDAAKAGRKKLSQLEPLSTWSELPRAPSSNEKIIDIPISMIEHGEAAMPGGTLSFPNAQETIQEYAQRNTEIPAIDVLMPDEDSPFFIVEDGSRRLEAAKLRGDKTIKAIVPKDYNELSQAGQSSLTDFMAEVFPKSYKPSIVEPYVGAGIDPRTFTAGSGSKASDPRVGDVERNLGTQIQYGDQRIQTIPEVNLEDYEGYPFISSISDTSGAGDVIQSIDGVPVNVSRRGGQDYMFDPLSGEFVWASARNVVKGAGANPPPGSLFGRALALKERTGKDPLFIPHSMTPTGSDFSQVADVMLSYAKNNMNKTTLKKLDKDIKSLIPDWKGLGDESSSEILNRAGGEQRKKIINLLDKDYADKGSLTAGQARLALTDQEQRIIRPGTLRNVGIVDTSRAPIVGTPHPIYDTGLYGSGVGRLTSPASVYELNPAAAYLGGITPEQIMSPPRSTGSQGGLRSLEGAPLTGIITEDVLRQMEMRRAMAK
jgi:uncharacterized ParB-like nuclease family protein